MHNLIISFENIGEITDGNMFSVKSFQGHGLSTYINTYH